MKQTFRSYAKLNLSLLVYAPLENGYHPIFSIFQKISLFDSITIEKIPLKKITLTSNIQTLEQDNILHKVYNYFEAQLNCGFRINVQKEIPLGSGMGGGSSNAAIFLNFLHIHHKIIKEDIIKCANTLGSDIAFFLDNSIATVSGFGEIIHSLANIYYPAFLLICPNIMSNTQEIYTKFDRLNKYREQNALIEDQLKSKHLGPNDLKESVWSTHTDYQTIECIVNELNIGPLHLSGSGSTLFIPLNDAENINEKKLRLSKSLAGCKIIDAYAIKDDSFHPSTT